MSIETEFDNYEKTSFGSRPRNGIFMGLDTFQCVLAFITLIFAGIFGVTLGFPAGPIVFILFIGVGAGAILPRINGTPLPTWVFRLFFHKFRSANEQTEYQRKWGSQNVAIADPDGEFTKLISDVPRDKKGRLLIPKPINLNLPGPDSQLDLYETPAGFSFIHDRWRGLGIIVGFASTQKAFELESTDRKFVRTKSFNEALVSISAVEGLEVTQLSDLTRLVSNQHIRDWYDRQINTAPRMTTPDGEEVPMAGPHLNEFLDQSYRDHINDDSTMASHSQLVAFAFNQHTLDTAIKDNGTGIAGFVETVMQKIDSLQNLLQQSGVVIEHWLAEREIGEVIRAAFDPLGVAAVNERKNDFAGVAPEVSGPMAMVEEWDHLRTDTGFHRTYWVSEWPRQGAGMGFLKDLVLAGDFAHVVTELLRPIPVDKALTIIERRKSDWGTTDKFREKSGRVQSFRHNSESADIDNHESQIVNGNAPFYVNGLITVTGSTKEELERNCSAMMGKASIARMEIRPTYSQQGAAFVAACLPFCKGISTAKIWGI